jgi:predicted acetyltransferase
VDEPLLHLVREPRRLRATVRDNLWLRLVDVEPSLSSRRYAAAGRVVVEVRDAFCPWNEGRYALEAGAGELGVAARTTEEPEIVCTVNEVAAAYLGGVSFRQLHRAGRVQERRPGALARADAMFGWDPAPWGPYVF